MIDKLKLLQSKCKCEIALVINAHKNSYSSVIDYLKQGDDDEDIEKAVLDEMIAKDTIIALIFYPQTPVGFYTVYHYDIDKCLDEALDIMKG